MAASSTPFPDANPDVEGQNLDELTGGRPADFIASAMPDIAQQVVELPGYRLDALLLAGGGSFLDQVLSLDSYILNLFIHKVSQSALNEVVVLQSDPQRKSALQIVLEKCSYESILCFISKLSLNSIINAFEPIL